MTIPLRTIVGPPALSEMDLPAAQAWATGHGLPSYRARQLMAALNVRGVQTFAELTDFSLSMRERLAEDFTLRTLTPRVHLHSRADGSEKVLFGLRDGATVESVLIPASDGRLTVCVSSQVGCPAGCTFCATGLSGFGRNLRGAEIADQVQYFSHSVRERGDRISNVVYMGMGEPFLNASAVQDSVARLTDPVGFNLGDRHLTVSTVGIVPQIRKFAEWGGQVNLAISLHAPNDELRSSLVPYNQHFPIADLMAVTREYVEKTNRRVSFEYVLLKGKNDEVHLATQLAELVRPFRGLAHVNLIPWNPFREGKFIRSEGPDAEAFAAELGRRAVNATIRYSKGLDISAACGQLRENEKTAS